MSSLVREATRSRDGGEEDLEVGYNRAGAWSGEHIVGSCILFTLLFPVSQATYTGSHPQTNYDVSVRHD